MQQRSIVFRITATGALGLFGAVGTCLGFGLGGEIGTTGALVALGVALTGTLIFWHLGRGLRDDWLAESRVLDITLTQGAARRERIEMARAMAAALGDRALAQSRQVRGDPESIKVAQIIDATHTLAGRLRDEVAGLIERLDAEPTPELRFRGACESALATASDANRLAVNAALSGTNSPRAWSEIARAMHGVMATLSATVVAAGGEPPKDASTVDDSNEVRDSLGRMRDALRTLLEGLEVVESSAGNHHEVADALATVCVDARFIDRELSSLLGVDHDEAVTSVDLPPHPLDWDRLEATVREDASPAPTPTEHSAVDDEPQSTA